MTALAASKVDVREVIKTKVEGIWIPAHDESGHHYRHRDTGTLVDSVTTQLILDKPHLIPWAVERGIEYVLERRDLLEIEPEKLIKAAKFAFTAVRDDAGNIGTQAHGYIEEYVNSWIATGERPVDIRTYIPEDSDGRVFAAARSAEKLFVDHGIVPIASEILVGDEKVWAAGTLDLLAWHKGKLAVVDWKTSNQVGDDYALQVAAYKYLFQRMTGLRILDCIIIKLSKDYADVKMYDIPNQRAAYNAFLGVSKAYRWLKNGEKKLVERKNRITI